jgi:hypothetical protein
MKKAAEKAAFLKSLLSELKTCYNKRINFKKEKLWLLLTSNS